MFSICPGINYTELIHAEYSWPYMLINMCDFGMVKLYRAGAIHKILPIHSQHYNRSLYQTLIVSIL